MKPDFAEAHNNLGGVLQELGDFHGAEDSFRAALRHNPRFASAHYNLAALLGGKLPEEDLAAQRRLLAQGSASGEQGGLTDAERSYLHFGLACVLDARGEYAEAAKHLDRGNALRLSEYRKRGQGYDPKEYEFLIARMIEACGPDFFQRVARLRVGKRTPGVRRRAAAVRHDAHRADIGQPLPGLRRGGDQTGQRHHGRARRKAPMPSRPSPLGPPDGPPTGCAALGETSRIGSRGPAHRRQEAGELPVSGSPGGPLPAGEVDPLPPRLARRGPLLLDDAISGKFAGPTTQRHIASRFHQYQRMMAHWRKVLPVPLLDVDYEETVADLEGVARRLVAWCGLEWEPKCLEFHRASGRSARPAPSRCASRSIRTSVGRWKHYEQSLAALLAAISGDQ